MRKEVVIGLATLGHALFAAAQEQIPERQMNVRQGPETVFDRRPAELFPALEGAAATGENGRVGSELVFWGYEQRDGGRVFLFACAPARDLDCATRVSAICPDKTTVLESRAASGNTVRRNCRSVAVTGPGDARPGCDDRVESASLEIGLVTCG